MARKPITRPNSNMDFDYRAEVEQNEKYKQTRSKHFLKPNLPAIEQEVELHTPTITESFVKWFVSTQARATYLDAIAYNRLKSKASYNGYLRKFDEFVANATDASTKKLAELEAQSQGHLASVKKPHAVTVEISGNRGMQILRCFVAADRLLRHAQYLEITGEITINERKSLEKKMTEILQAMGRSCSNVAVACKQEIQRQNSLKAKTESAAPADKAPDVTVTTVSDEPAETDLPIVTTERHAAE